MRPGQEPNTKITETESKTIESKTIESKTIESKTIESKTIEDLSKEASVNRKSNPEEKLQERLNRRVRFLHEEFENDKNNDTTIDMFMNKSSDDKLKNIEPTNVSVVSESEQSKYIPRMTLNEIEIPNSMEPKTNNDQKELKSIMKPTINPNPVINIEIVKPPEQEEYKQSLNIDISTVSEYRKIWKEKRYVCIPNFLKLDEANKFLEYMLRMRPNMWTAVSRWGNNDGVIGEYKNIKKNERFINKIRQKANIGFRKGDFSYFFYKTMHPKNEKELVNDQMMMYQLYLMDKFRSNGFIAWINRATGGRFTRVTNIFFSKYKSGCFLSPHCDKNNGRVAFVLNLTQNWQPEWGGVLHVMNKERTKITDSFVPTFNSLVLMDLPNGEGLPHYVSHILSNVDRSRLAVTGWLE